MTFPLTPLDVTVEIDLGGTWTDITDYVYVRDGIAITRGRSDEAAQVERGTARMTLDNRDGRFSPRNPVGAYYGQLGRNTQLRVGVKRGGVRLDLPGAAGDKASAPDATALGVTGDIDIRIDATMANWLSRDLCGKYLIVGDQRSWSLQTDFDGTLVFTWTTLGTSASGIIVRSTLPLSPYPGRKAVRVTMDVNNGAAGRTITFYTADSINGSWTQLGDAVVTAGTTSVFDSTAAVELGDIAALTVVNGTSNTSRPVDGQVNAFELRNGIAGTVVANPDFTAQAEGATSFADTASSPNTWTLAGGASLTSRRWRFVGEVPAWPVSWDASGNDVYVPIEASGILRRLGQGASPLRSTLYRGLVTLAESAPVAYWPMEDAAGSRQIASGLPGGDPAQIYGAPELATSDVFACSSALPVLRLGGVNAPVRPYTATGESQVRLLVNIPSTGATDGAILCRIWTTGSARQWDLRYNTSLAGSFTILVYDDDGTLIATSANMGSFNGTSFRASLELVQDGADIDYSFQTNEVGHSGGGGDLYTLAGRTFGTVYRVVIDPSLSLDEVTVGHLSVHSEVTIVIDLWEELAAYAGEGAGRRVERLCAEEGIPFASIGNLDNTEPMGVQAPAELLTLIQECIDADLGIGYERREALGLGYRTRKTLYNQAPRIELDYDAREVAGALDPVDDDQATRNDVTASRQGGSSARASLTSGPMSVQDPPDGVGRYDESVTLNVEEDARLGDLANWRVHLGTVDEARYPQIDVNLAGAAIVANADLDTALLDHEFGDRLTISNPPTWLPPDQISQFVQGYSETLESYGHRMTLNCSPELPWRVAVYSADHYDTGGSELVSGVSSSATSLDVLTTVGPIWTTDGAHMPFDIRVGGEQMTVTAITSAARDAFGRTVASGWGTADSGQAWANTGGAAADFSVSGGLGRHSMGTATNISRWTTLTSPSADFDLTATVATDITPAGGSHFVYLAGRWTGTNDNYIARVEFTTGSAVALTIRKRVGGTETSLGGGTVPGLTHAANTRFGVRFAAVGSTLTAKVWLASGFESAWFVTASDPDITAAGSLGFRSILAAGVSNPLPVTATFDNLALLTPQTMTVTRAVNGVSKSQAAGAAVALANTPIYAL